MAAKTGTGSGETVSVFLVALLLFSGGEVKAAFGFVWPHFLFCLPESLLGETCFMKAYKKCMDSKETVAKGRSPEFCIQVAQYYCDIGHQRGKRADHWH